MNEKKLSIAIDGPAGAGKSTLAKALAKKLGYVYVDTGAIYRCVGLYALEKGVAPKDASGVEALLPEIRISLSYDETGLQRMHLCGKDVTGEIRKPEVSMAASAVSAIPAVRAFLLDMQRDMARRYNVIMDGRDIGTVVLPDANVKIFLTASPGARAKRRYLELQAKGDATPFEEVLRDMLERDHNDTTRAAAPLKAAEDAVLLDTTPYTLEESIDLLARVAMERLG